jgi:hypothetical protein
MGNDNSTGGDGGGGNSSDNSSSWNNTPAIETYCYTTGFDHGYSGGGLNPDPIGQAIDAAVCTTSEAANNAYAEGYKDAMESKNK